MNEVSIFSNYSQQAPDIIIQANSMSKTNDFLNLLEPVYKGCRVGQIHRLADIFCRYQYIGIGYSGYRPNIG